MGATTVKISAIIPAFILFVFDNLFIKRVVLCCMTQQLFLEDCYLQTCTAEVLFVDGFFVELSATVFYPMGGGQSHDTGTLTCQDQVYTVVDVLKQEGKLLHKIDHEGLR